MVSRITLLRNKAGEYIETLKGSPKINTSIAANNDKDLVELAGLHGI